MINIGIVGCGNWAIRIIDEINCNKHFNLTSIVCRKKNKTSNLKVFDSVEAMINSNINDSIYVAAYPDTNLEVIKLLNKNNIPVILEKPTTSSLKNIEELKIIANNNKLIIYPNLTNYFSETYLELKEIVKENLENITEIIIYEGGFGPFRNNIHPVWDWGYHSISLIYLLFENEIISNIEERKIKSNNLFGKGIVSKFIFKVNKKIKVKIITGNLFKKKLRKIKIKLKNNNFFLNDMVSHKLYYNDRVIFKNVKSPITSLLDEFKKAIELNDYKKSKNLINASFKTTGFLENFYKC